MSQVITDRVRVSRRSLLKEADGFPAHGLLVGLPPLVSMFNCPRDRVCSAGRWGGEACRVALRPVVQRQRHSGALLDSAAGRRHVSDDALPRGRSLRFRTDIHVLSGVDNAARDRMGNGHTNSMSGLMTGTDFTGRGPSGPSIDQVIAAKIGDDSRFRSLQIGVAQESIRREHAAQYELGRIRSAPCRRI